MAISKTALEYISLSTGNWTKAVNADGNDAVVMLNVEQSINASAKADIILSNRSPDPSSSNPTNAKGPLTNVFAEFQRIRLVHQEVGIPIFSGRIYRIRDVYDAQYGQTIRLVAFDSLKELREFPIEDAEDSLESVDTTSSNVGGYDVRKRSQLIKYMLDEVNLKDKNLLTTDTDHFEDSWSTASLGDKKLNLVKLDRHVAGVIQELAVADPVKNSSATAIGESGYDYRVEPRFLSSAVTHKPIDSLHYFMRGTRPGKGGAYGASAAPVLTTTTTDSLTIEYTNSDSAADSGVKQTMMPQYEFDKPKAELYTAVVCHYTDEGKEDESTNDESGGKSEGVVTFELLKGTALSGTFTWANKALDVNKKGVINVPEYLTYGGNNVAVVQWQNTASNYLLISHIDEATFPTTGSVTLTGASSSATFAFNAATGRMKTKYGVERPVRIQRPLSSNLGIIRDEIVARLVGRTDLEIVRGKFQTVKYPIVYHDLPSNAARSTNTITWSGTVAARTRGVRKGHIIAEIDSLGQYVRYAYISVVTSDTSITYGSSATDTSDGTALNVSNTIRVVIPLRPGDVIKVVNAQSDVNTDQVILSLGYDESPGMFAARYETVGSNNKFNNIYEEGEDLRASIAAVAPKKFPDATKALAETSFFFDGFVNRGVNPSSANDYRQIHWTNASGATSGTAGTLTTGDGSKYTIACANSATLTTAEHTIFFRPTTARATVNKSDTTFQIILTTNYKKDADDIYVGWCKASDNKAGAKAVLVLVPQFTSQDLFASGQNGTLTEALLSKSAQEYASGLEITALTSGSDRHRQVTWAACTSAEDRLTFGDGDYWSIAAKSGSNYSVTSNGSTYTNITALALSSTYYVFIDTADTASGGTLTLRFTTSYSHISTASDGTFRSSRVLMAQIAVPANGDDGAAPRIFPFNNRSLTLNAASIAADAITATHITASTVTTIRGTKADIGLGDVDNLDAAALRGGVTPLHVSDNMTGVTMDTSGNIYSGSKSSYGSNTSGWFIGFDSSTPKINIGSGSNRIRWTGSALEIIGQIQLTSGGDVLSEANTLNAQQAWSDIVSGGGKPADDATVGLGGTGVRSGQITTDITGGTASAPTFTGTDTILDSKGICGFASNALQFYLLSSNGKAYFAGGAITADANGLTINQVGSSNASSFLTFKSTGGSGSHFYRLISANGYPAHTQLYSAGEDAAGHVFVTTGDGTGFISAGTSTNDTTLGRNISYEGFKGLYLSYSAAPAQTANSSGVIYTKTDGHIYWKGRNSSGTAIAEVSLSSGGGGGSSDDGVFYIQTDSGGGGSRVSVSTHATTNPTIQIIGGSGITVTNSGVITTIAATGGGGGSGDITAVVAGAGLTGGATSGSATLAINYSTNHSFASGNSINAGYFQSNLISTTNSGLYAAGSPGQFNKGMWISDETAPSSPSSGFIRLYSESNVLKYKKSNGNIVNISSGSTGSGVIGTADQFSIPIYSNAGSDEEVGNSNWEILSGGSLLTPKNDGTQTVGVLYQSGGVDVGIKGFAGWESSLSGNPPYAFSNVSNTGMSYRTSGGYSFVNFETNDTDIFRIGLLKIIVLQGGIVPGGNNLRHIGSTQTGHPRSYSVQNDLRFSQGAFDDLSTTGSLWMHYGDYGESSYLEESQLHVKPAMFYEFATSNSQTSVDLVVQTYANDDQWRVARESSTIRNKDNVRDIEVDTNKIYDLVPRTFEWKNSGETAFGLVAEEVDEIIPALVTRWPTPVLDENGIPHEDGDPIPQGVDYKRISVLLLTEMKKLKERIDVLEGS